MQMTDNRRKKIIARQRKLENETKRVAKAAKRDRNKGGKKTG